MEQRADLVDQLVATVTTRIGVPSTD
jgi:hypothetical protein